MMVVLLRAESRRRPWEPRSLEKFAWESSWVETLNCRDALTFKQWLFKPSVSRTADCAVFVHGRDTKSWGNGGPSVEEIKKYYEAGRMNPLLVQPFTTESRDAPTFRGKATAFGLATIERLLDEVFAGHDFHTADDVETFLLKLPDKVRALPRVSTLTHSIRQVLSIVDYDLHVLHTSGFNGITGVKVLSDYAVNSGWQRLEELRAKIYGPFRGPLEAVIEGVVETSRSDVEEHHKLDEAWSDVKKLLPDFRTTSEKYWTRQFAAIRDVFRELRPEGDLQTVRQAIENQQVLEWFEEWDEVLQELVSAAEHLWLSSKGLQLKAES